MSLILTFNREEKMKIDYLTTDFYLSCFLTISGQNIRKIRRVGNSTQMEFVFTDSDKLRKLVDEYFWNKAKVDPMVYKDQIRKVKSMLYNS